MGTLNMLENAYLLIEAGKIRQFGPMEEAPGRADTILDLQNKMVWPCWCDSHTHIVYAESREEEFVMRLKGMSYMEIAERGGGILNSAKKMKDVDENNLYFSAKSRLDEMISYGTGAVEIKSGYGLTFEGEMKMLRVIKRLKETYSIPIKSTFLGAHAIPATYRNDRQAYIELLTEKMIPYVAGEGLADYCDVFCDTGFFTVSETDTILKAGQKYGLKAKIHANELDFSGGVQIGVANNAVSVDHLECVAEDEIAALLSGNTMPTLLPSTAFFLNIEYAPARKMIDAGLPVTLASDYNPGSTPSGRMPFVLSLACLKMKMTPEEAIHAATINGARAMEIQKSHGSICIGKAANLFITPKMKSVAYLPYAFGSDLIEKVLLNGEIAYSKN